MILDHAKTFHKYFEEISQIPHGSGNEQALSDYLVRFAQNHALSYTQDKLHNVIIYKQASAGYETHKSVILQGQMDMVCAKEPNYSFNFKQDPLHLYIENGWLRARGTTLGADDGIAVAYMLSILSNSALAHPALECIFTVQEETNMSGATFLNYANIHSTRMIGLDSSGEYTTLNCSSGALALQISIPFSMSPSFLPCFTLAISGLEGGHSGKLHADSNEHHAVLIGMHFIEKLLSLPYTIQLVSIQGGEANNTIPRESSFIFSTDIPSHLLFCHFKQYFHDLKERLFSSEQHLKTELLPCHTVFSSIEALQSNLIVSAIAGMPHGIQNYHSLHTGVPDVSLNMGIIKTLDRSFQMNYLIRFFDKEQPQIVYKKILSCIKPLKGHISQLYSYPSWEQNPDSELESILMKTFENMYHIPLKHKYNPGGTEYGIFSQNIPHLDLVAFGPIRENIHTPQEALNIASFDRIYKLLITFLENL